MKQSLIRQGYTVLDEPLRQWWLAYPTLAATSGNDQIAVYNMDDGAWSLYNLAMNTFGYFDQTKDLTWADCTFNWEDAGFKWGDRSLQGGYPVVLGGTVDGNVYAIDSGVSDAGSTINMAIKSARMNPFVKNGVKARLGWVKFMVDTNSAITLTINFYANHSDTPYMTYDMTLNDGRGQEKSWLSLPVGVSAQFHQIEMLHDGPTGIGIHAMIPYFQEGGPV
jgi:hypothetical protein